MYEFSRKNFLMLFYCLITFTSWDIEKYVYWNSLFPRLWHQKCSSNLIFLIKPFSYLTNKSSTWEPKEFLRWSTKHQFSSVSKGLQLLKFVSGVRLVFRYLRLNKKLPFGETVILIWSWPSTNNETLRILCSNIHILLHDRWQT